MKKVILVIEDEVPLLTAVQAKLEKGGFKVIDARSVDQAFNAKLEGDDTNLLTIDNIERTIKYLEELEQVDAIWLDHNLLGGENGLDFVARFKGNGGHWSNVPIFVVSNTSSPEMIKEYANLGVNKYYVKAEYRLEDIISDIEKALEGKAK